VKVVIALGSDHGGYNLKKEIIKYLSENKYEIKDFGCCDNQPVDYPQYAFNVADAIVSGECEKGILICGTGIGMSIAANKIRGIRAAVCTDTYMAKMSREHNDANILALGERVIGKGLALDIVAVWLKSEFLGGIHKSRVDQIMMKEI
jgi:ribose 5-phosphate isomerase B